MEQIHKTILMSYLLKFLKLNSSLPQLECKKVCKCCSKLLRNIRTDDEIEKLYLNFDESDLFIYDQTDIIFGISKCIFKFVRYHSTFSLYSENQEVKVIEFFALARKYANIPFYNELGKGLVPKEQYEFIKLVSIHYHLLTLT